MNRNACDRNPWGAGGVRGLKSASTFAAWLPHVGETARWGRAIPALHWSRSDRPTVDVNVSPRTPRLPDLSLVRPTNSGRTQSKSHGAVREGHDELRPSQGAGSAQSRPSRSAAITWAAESG